MSQMVQNGEAKCTRKVLSNIEEKTIVEDDLVDVKVLNPLNKFRYNFKWLMT